MRLSSRASYLKRASSTTSTRIIISRSFSVTSSDKRAPTSEERRGLRRDNSFDRDRENVIRGLYLVAREMLLQTKTPAEITNALKFVSDRVKSRADEEQQPRGDERSWKNPDEQVVKKVVGAETEYGEYNTKTQHRKDFDHLRSEHVSKPDPSEIRREITRSSEPLKRSEPKIRKLEPQRKQPSWDDVEPIEYTPPPPEKKNFHEASVPSTPISRAIGFGSLFTGLAMGTIAEATRRATGLSSSPSGTSSWISDANAERLASTLCRMRGAALKLGQMLSIQDEHMLPGPLGAALERVRAGADRMPDSQLNAVLSREFGRTDWEQEFFQSFDRNPIAAASLGQVHSGVLKDGRKVALKVQYPGVAESIESDVANLRRLVRLTGIFPRGLFIDKILDVVGLELSEECDYEKEAQHQIEFARLFHEDKAFKVPYVVPELSTKRVLTMEYVSGIPLDKVVELPQHVRDRVGRMLLRLTLRELFEFGYVQSDPNFANYLYNPATGQLCLLDFGATKRYDEQFVDDYAVLVWAAGENDRDTLLRKSIEIGLLNGQESEEMKNAHCESAFEIAEPFSRRTRNLSYDFANSEVSARIAHYGPTFMRDRLIPPPQEIYSLHRKLSGAFMACVRIKSKFPCRDLLEHAVKRRIKEAEQRRKLSEPKV